MAFILGDFARVSSSGNFDAPAQYSYKSTSDSLATVTGSGYFNKQRTFIRVDDVIYVAASDDQEFIRVTAVSPNVTTEAMSGELDALPDGDIFVGSASNVPTAQTMSGDLTITNAGVTSIGDDKLVGKHPSPIVAQDATGYLTVSFGAGDASGGAGGSDDIVMAKPFVVHSFLVMVEGAGTPGDTVRLHKFDGVNKNVSEAIDVSSSVDGDIIPATFIDSGNKFYAAGDTLRVTYVDGGSADAPNVTVIITGFNQVG
jgi:hypothetical protein